MQDEAVRQYLLLYNKFWNELHKLYLDWKTYQKRGFTQEEIEYTNRIRIKVNNLFIECLGIYESLKTKLNPNVKTHCDALNSLYINNIMKNSSSEKMTIDFESVMNTFEKNLDVVYEMKAILQWHVQKALGNQNGKEPKPKTYILEDKRDVYQK